MFPLPLWSTTLQFVFTNRTSGKRAARVVPLISSVLYAGITSGAVRVTWRPVCVVEGYGSTVARLPHKGRWAATGVHPLPGCVVGLLTAVDTSTIWRSKWEKVIDDGVILLLAVDDEKMRSWVQLHTIQLSVSPLNCVVDDLVTPASAHVQKGEITVALPCTLDSLVFVSNIEGRYGDWALLVSQPTRHVLIVKVQVPTARILTTGVRAGLFCLHTWSVLQSLHG